jgi:molybdopterin molybdotransferase
VGDHDLVRQALIDWGAKVHAWKVAMKPGKPLIVAKRGDLAILGLPGNPVSSFVTAFLFALPMVRKVMGFAHTANATMRGRMAQPLPPIVGPRREFLRARVEHGEVRLAGSQDSSALRALAEANCLIDRPAGSRAAVVGEEVTLLPLRNG